MDFTETQLTGILGCSVGHEGGSQGYAKYFGRFSVILFLSSACLHIRAQLVCQSFLSYIFPNINQQDAAKSRQHGPQYFPIIPLETQPVVRLDGM